MPCVGVSVGPDRVGADDETADFRDCRARLVDRVCGDGSRTRRRAFGGANPGNASGDDAGRRAGAADLWPARALVEKSDGLGELVKKGRLRVVPALYDVETAHVALLD